MERLWYKMVVPMVWLLGLRVRLEGGTGKKLLPLGVFAEIDQHRVVLHTLSCPVPRWG